MIILRLPDHDDENYDDKILAGERNFAIAKLIKGMRVIYKMVLFLVEILCVMFLVLIILLVLLLTPPTGSFHL